MRSYDMAVFLLLFGAVVGVLDASMVWDSGSIYTGEVLVDQSSFDNMQDINGTTVNPILTGPSLSTAFGAFAILWGALGSMAFIAPIIASAFGDSSAAWSVALMIQSGIWLVYASALFQLVSGKQLKGME